MPLAKLADLKTLMGTSSSDQDELLTLMLQTATATAERVVGVADGGLQRSVDRVEWPMGTQRQQRFLTLASLPVESISDVRQYGGATLDADIDTETPLVENDDYVFDRDAGKLERLESVWYCLPRCVRVVYTGGFIDPATSNPPSTAIQPPRDLQHGVLQEALRLWQRRDLGGVTQISAGAGGSVSLAIDQPHPDLIAACQRWRRWSL